MLQLTKFLGGMLMPLFPILLFLTGGLVLFALNRKRRLALTFLSIGVILLWIFSFPGPGRQSLRRLEGTYPLLNNPPPEAEWIVVLGGGVLFHDDRPAVTRLGGASLYRVMEGIRLAREIPGAVLVLSAVETAPVMAEVALEMGIDPSRIVVHDTPRNTYEEALEVAKIVEPGQSVILVTSASHMRRAASLFRGQGISVIPSPTGYRAGGGGGEFYIVSLLPNAANIVSAEIFLREKLGLAWACLRGWCE